MQTLGSQTIYDMKESTTLNDLGTLIGVVAGTAALVLSLLNYLRDRHKIVVELKWDLDVMNVPGYDVNKHWGVIRITNTGRRPIYVSHVGIKLPKGYQDTHLLVMEGLQGEKLEEGAPPLTYPLDQEGLDVYKKHWKKLRAQVSDSTGKVWMSPRVWRGDPPSWALIKN